MKCSYCGNELKPGVNFCNKCGRAVVGEEKENKDPTAAISEQDSSSKGKKWIVLVILLSAAVIILLGIILFILNSKKGKDDHEEVIRHSETTEIQTEVSEWAEEVDADIDGINGPEVTVEGIILSDDNTFHLQLDDTTTIYAYNENGEKQLIDTEKLFFNQNGSTSYRDYYYWRVVLEGIITISEDKAYISVTGVDPIISLSVQKETESELQKDEGEYVFADSSSRYLRKEEVQYLSDYELMIARNEIYARHGRKFNDRELRTYFNSKAWYNPRINPEDFKEEYLNDYEKKNIELIKSFE